MRQCLGHRRAFSCAGCRAQPSRGTALRCTAQARKRDANRRELIALGLLASQATQQPAWADEGAGASGTQRCYMDMAVDGQAQGRIVIELDDMSTVGAQRFSDLCKGIEGVGYRRSKIDAIFPVWQAILHLNAPCCATIHSCSRTRPSNRAWTHQQVKQRVHVVLYRLAYWRVHAAC